MAQINDPKVTGTRYYFLGREKRNVTGWARYMNNAEFKAYSRPAEYVFRTLRTEYNEDGSSVTRFEFGRRGGDIKEAFRIERDAYATERYNETMRTVWEF